MAPDADGKLEYLGPLASAEAALAVLSAPVRDWFQQHFGQPTPAQCLAWPALVRQQNLLLCAPTGSGKTLAAFLPILDQLLARPFAASVRCLYVAPLKALIHDVRHNLRRYLRGLRVNIPSAASLRVGLRTGDTSARVRRALWREPPDVFLTTPETLAVLLSHAEAAHLFAGLRWVVVDELHALACNKRGADLSLSLERLTALAGEDLQRVGLSATCTPLELGARFLAGSGRSCRIGQVPDSAPWQFTVEPLPEESGQGSSSPGFLARLLHRLEPELVVNRTTLIFTNVRSLAERLTWALRRRFPDWAEQIGVHHSALAPARRRWVERKLKKGLLRVVVSSCSLELGIDIGAVEGVVLVHPPGGVVRLLQRVGRSGHAPGQPRCGLVLTANPPELLEAVVTAASGQSGQMEALRLPRHPLDVLCQQVLGLAAQGWQSPAEAFELVRRAFPYQELPWTDFQDCLDYLSGRNRAGQSWLPARLRWHEDRFTIADPQTIRLLRRNLGTILAEEHWEVRFPEGPAVGQVEEAFAQQLNPGDRFLLDGRCLEVHRCERQTVLVEEVGGRPLAPRWGGEGWPLSAELARRLYALRVEAAEALRDGPGGLRKLFREEYGLGSEAAAVLGAYFQRQECVSEIPDATTCLIEVVSAFTHRDYYLHTPLNRAGNDALARVAVHRLARSWNRRATGVAADLGLVLSLEGARDFTPEEFRTLLSR
ncbi:MAG: DEAD/DEAH box helicase, partial [Planctomycetes bacterium]|nr:DEAD/DEAH box helicase [Planctomycetota bacterium]